MPLHGSFGGGQAFLQGNEPSPTDPNDPFSTRPLGSDFSLFDYYRQVQANIAKGLLDPQSQFYQRFRAFLGGVTPSPGANSFLSLLQAGGGGFGASQAQAQQLQRGAEGRRQDFLNTATRGFASNAINAGIGVLGQAQQNLLGQEALKTQKGIAEGQQGGFLDFLGTLAGTGIGFAVGGPPGAAVGAGIASQAQPSNIF